ncbi:universal stress protein [Paraflavitalea pollutisoli]|uniref:universal stress protein n=1 Tax=Paraflavitalea pollutisoli TaxID=3034143 RepID=UPI0023ED237E|nr:universal stress protein [Paraflavitalea sp. H1-2-19X]
MKKILVALDGLKLSKPTIQYAVSIAAKHRAHLVAVFLDDVTYHSYKIFELVGPEGVQEEKRTRLEEGDIGMRSVAAQQFTTACDNASVDYSVHHDRNIALQELIHESIYADLLIISEQETLTHYTENPPTRFVRDLLESVQCPVLVVPDHFKAIKKVCLLFDGEPSSVFAVRMFGYTLAELIDSEVEVVTVKKPGLSGHVPDNHLMKEFMKRHFATARYVVLHGDPETEILRHLRSFGEDTLLVLGAYRRGMVSRWFRPSMADLLMMEKKMPLFIAHNK